MKGASFIALLFLQEQIKRASFLVSALVDPDIKGMTERVRNISMKNCRKFKYTDCDGDKLNIDFYVKEKDVILTVMNGDDPFFDNRAFMLDEDLFEKVTGTLQACLSKMKGD